MDITQYNIDLGLKRISTEEKYSILLEILKYTIEINTLNKSVCDWSDKFWTHPFISAEMSVMIHMSDALATNGQLEKSVLLLEKMFKFYKDSRIKPEFHYRTVILILGRLSSYYGLLHVYEKELSFAEKGIATSMGCANWRLFPVFINNKADALENIGKKEASLKYYKLAFYCSELMQTTTAEIAKRSYEKLIGGKIDWY